MIFHNAFESFAIICTNFGELLSEEERKRDVKEGNSPGRNDYPTVLPEVDVNGRSKLNGHFFEIRKFKSYLVVC